MSCHHDYFLPLDRFINFCPSSVRYIIMKLERTIPRVCLFSELCRFGGLVQNFTNGKCHGPHSLQDFGDGSVDWFL